MQSPSVSIEKSLALDAILGETGYDPESGIKSRNRSYGRAEALRSTKERFSIFPNMASKRAESINSQTSTESYVKKTEELGDFEARLNLDVEKRMNYYFPLWRKNDQAQQIFGYKYYRDIFSSHFRREFQISFGCMSQKVIKLKV